MPRGILPNGDSTIVCLQVEWPSRNWNHGVIFLRLEAARERAREGRLRSGDEEDGALGPPSGTSSTVRRLSQENREVRV